MYIIVTLENRPIKIDFFNFEKLYFGVNSFNNNNFFALLDDKYVENLFFLFLKENSLRNENLDKLFKRDINNLVTLLQEKNLNFSNFLYFKSEYDVLNAYLFLFTLKTFSLKGKKRKNDHDFSSFSSREFLFDRNDFINLFLDFLFKFFLFNEVKLNIPFIYSRDYLRKFVFRFIELCVKKKIIEIYDIRIRNRHYKSLIFVPLFLPYTPHIVFYTEKFNYYIRSDIEFYSYNSHFSSLGEISKQAKYSNSHFKIPSEQISTLFERSIYIDRSLLEKCFIFLLKDQKLDENSDLIEVSKNLSQKIEKFTFENDLGSLRFYHSKLSKLLTLIRIKTTLSMNFDNLELYLPFMFCFRGRIYELSDLSFTFYKEFRFCTYSGTYKDESGLFHPINAQILNTIEKQFVLLEKFEWFNTLSIIRKSACIWIFISIGAMKKTEIGREIHISSFIIKGIELWEKKDYKNFEDVYEKIEFNYLINLINEVKFTRENLKKWIFWKDAPASCFQHLLLILGPRDENSYKICNLDSIDTWYDSYSYLILDFFEKNCDKITKNLYSKAGLMLTKLKFFEIFSRKRLKKVLMTESYGAGYKKLTSFFILNLELENYPKEEETAIMSIWEDFFNYISNENVLFAQSSKEITEYFVNNKIKKIINPDQTEVDYSCFQVEITQIEIYVEKKRHTLQKRIMTTEENKSQFKTSLRANFVQSQDAILARKYILITRMWSIHDCFSIDFLNITYMVALLNELMNGEFFDIKINYNEKKRIYSIFLVL